MTTKTREGTDAAGTDISIRDSTAYGGGWFGKPPEKEPVGAVTPSHDDPDDPTKQTENKARAAQAPSAKRNEAATKGISTS